MWLVSWCAADNVMRFVNYTYWWRHLKNFRRSEGEHRGDVFDVFPGFLGTVVMTMVKPGDWLLYCLLFDHLHSGMQTVYSVLPRGDWISLRRIALKNDEIISLCWLVKFDYFFDVGMHSYRASKYILFVAKAAENHWVMVTRIVSAQKWEIGR